MDFEWAAPAPATDASRVVRRRVVGKTSAADAIHLGFEAPAAPSDDDADSMDDEAAMMEDGLPAETREVPMAVMDIHGGFFLQTDDILWCSRCGASAKLGWFSAYLRKACEGKPANASMRQRRKRLIRGVHPTTCKPLVSPPKRVRII